MATTYRGIPVIRRGRDWLETLLLQATGRGWDSSGPDPAERARLEEAERAAAEDWRQRAARTATTEAHAANAARRRALGLPSNSQRKALIRAQGQVRCGSHGVCAMPLDGYVSTWRRAEDDAGLCRECDAMMERDHIDLSAHSAARPEAASPPATPAPKSAQPAQPDPADELLRQRLHAEWKAPRRRSRRG